MSNNYNIVENAFKIGANRYANIPIDSLAINSKYQRDLSMEHVKKLAKNWNDEECDELRVCYHEDEDIFYVIDGNHRREAAALIGKRSLPCKILVGKTEIEEAKLFADQDRLKRKLTPYDRFKGNLAGNDPAAHRLQNLCDKYGIRIMKYAQRSTGALNSLSTAYSYMEKGQDEKLDWIFKVVEMARWNYSLNAYSEAMLEAMSSMYNKYHEVENADIYLARALSVTTPVQVKEMADVNHPGRVPKSAISTWMDTQMKTALANKSIISLEKLASLVNAQ